MFNNYFFDKDSKSYLEEFLKSEMIAVLMDPPFGGRVEPLANTLESLNKDWIKMNNVKDDGKLKDLFKVSRKNYIGKSNID